MVLQLIELRKGENEEDFSVRINFVHEGMEYFFKRNYQSGGVIYIRRIDIA